jgi:FkbM family methyltransferase
VTTLRTLVRVLAGLLRHPVGRRHPVRTLFRFVRWQIVTRVRPGPREVPFVGGTRLLVSRGMTGATGNVYLGLHEFAPMSLVLDALRPEDLFLDVGANVGSYTVLASGVVGCRTIAFEPVPATVEALEANVRLNDLGDRVRVVQAAVGDTSGTVLVTTTRDTTNRVLTEEESTDGGASWDDRLEVPLVRLDDAVSPAELAAAERVILKIDVEGFEVPVLRGAEGLLASGKVLAVLVEINGSGAAFGHADADIVEVLRQNRLVEVGNSPVSCLANHTSELSEPMRIFTGGHLRFLPAKPDNLRLRLGISRHSRMRVPADKQRSHNMSGLATAAPFRARSAGHRRAEG